MPHTPGPWTATLQDNDQCFMVTAPDGNDCPWQVAIILSACGHGETEEEGDTPSNALLVAAAPDMLAACELALADMVDEKVARCTGYGEAYAALQSAVAKAGGLRDGKRHDAAARDMLAALKGLEMILNIAESNASGQPEWNLVSAKIEAARAAIAKAEKGNQ